MFHFVKDTNDSVSEIALSEFAPLMRDSKSGMKMRIDVVQKLMSEVMEILHASPIKPNSDKNPEAKSNLRIPRNAQQKQVFCLNFFWIGLDLGRQFVATVH